MSLRNRLFKPHVNNPREFQKHLKIYICSWNVNSVYPSFNLNDLKQFDDSNQPDICVFGFQEINSNPLQRILDYFFNDPWTNSLTDLMGSNYINVSTVRLVGILLNVFVKRSVLTCIQYSINSWIRLGFCGLWGNKGASICTLNICGSSICFINSHLSAHEENIKKRKQEYSKIIESYLKSNDNTQADYLFFFGDLNFRVEQSIDGVKELLSRSKFTKLLEYDQLNIILKQNESLFKNVKEMNILFPPTYKFDLNTNNYDTSAKKRIPSWCDRILYKINQDSEINECTHIAYNHLPQFNHSDHKPIYGLYDIKTQHFKIESSVNFGDIFSNKEQNLEIVYYVNENVITHSKDWIGLFKLDFKGINDYVTYAWSDRILELENKCLKIDKDNSKTYERKVTIEQNNLNSGTFLVGYFSHVSNHLIGLSSSFELRIE